jgi:hypothetical protein
MPPNSLEFIAMRLHHALSLMPCGCGAIMVLKPTADGALKRTAVSRRCIRHVATDLYEASEWFNPPHVDAA